MTDNDPYVSKPLLWGKHCRGPGCDDFNEQIPSCACKCSACKKRPTAGVSSGWVLNQLAGISFPETGAAYMHMKRLLDAQDLRVWHHMIRPGVAGCGADYANMAKTEALEEVTCLECLRHSGESIAEWVENIIGSQAGVAQGTREGLYKKSGPRGDLLDRLCTVLGWSRVPEVGALEKVQDLCAIAKAAHRIAVLQPGIHAKNDDEKKRWSEFYKAINVIEPIEQCRNEASPRLTINCRCCRSVIEYGWKFCAVCGTDVPVDVQEKITADEWSGRPEARPHLCENDGTQTVTIPTCPKCGEEYLNELTAVASDARLRRERAKTCQKIDVDVTDSASPRTEVETPSNVPSTAPGALPNTSGEETRTPTTTRPRNTGSGSAKAADNAGQTRQHPERVPASGVVSAGDLLEALKDDDAKTWPDSAIALIEAAFTLVRAHERELCAKVALDYAPGCQGGQPIAAAILRLRSGKPHDPLKRWERMVEAEVAALEKATQAMLDAANVCMERAASPRTGHDGGGT